MTPEEVSVNHVLGGVYRSPDNNYYLVIEDGYNSNEYYFVNIKDMSIDVAIPYTSLEEMDLECPQDILVMNVLDLFK